MADFSAMSLTELKEEAKKLGLKGISAMRKTELVDILSAQEKPEAVVEEPKVQEERPVAPTAPATEARRPAQYQERTQTNNNAQRRPAAPGTER